MRAPEVIDGDAKFFLTRSDRFTPEISIDSRRIIHYVTTVSIISSNYTSQYHQSRSP